MFLESSVKFVYYLLVTLNDVSTITFTGWLSKESSFDSRQTQKLSLVQSAQASSEAHIASFSVGTGGFVPYGRSVNRTTHCHVLSKLRISGALRLDGMCRGKFYFI
jgi:hypothetical protein